LGLKALMICPVAMYVQVGAAVHKKINLKRILDNSCAGNYLVDVWKFRMTVQGA